MSARKLVQLPGGPVITPAKPSFIDARSNDPGFKVQVSGKTVKISGNGKGPGDGAMKSWVAVRVDGREYSVPTHKGMKGYEALILLQGKVQPPWALEVDTTSKPASAQLVRQASEPQAPPAALRKEHDLNRFLDLAQRAAGAVRLDAEPTGRATGNLDLGDSVKKS